MERIDQRAVAVDLEVAPTVLACGVVLTLMILSFAVGIVIVRGSWSSREPDQYALHVLSGLPEWLWPWRGKTSKGAAMGTDPAVAEARKADGDEPT